MSSRLPEFRALLESVAQQDHKPTRIVVVANGSELPDLPPGVIGIHSPVNLGVTGGRNLALATLKTFDDIDIVVDLDDDGLLVQKDAIRRVVENFDSDARLGIVSFRIVNEHGQTLRKHVPRLRKDALRRGLVTNFLGTGHALSMPMLNEIGDWPEDFFFSHEETDLAWRAIDGGWNILYDPQILLQHPWKTSRNPVQERYGARNRVWVAKRRLPASLVPVYIGIWGFATLLRSRSVASFKSVLSGYAEGLRASGGVRSPMKWKTVYRMSLLGRPPII